MPQNFNQEDPAKQERIRRGSHEYVPGEGRHGTYVERPYMHQEYPKFMDKTPAPKFDQFKRPPKEWPIAVPYDSQKAFDDAIREWERTVSASIVRNKAEEEKWLAQHEPDPEQEVPKAAPAAKGRKAAA